MVIFSDETPYELIRSLNPDVLVKGGDYEGKDIVGQDIVGDVRIVDFIEGKATTMTINRIRDNDRAS